MAFLDSSEHLFLFTPDFFADSDTLFEFLYRFVDIVLSSIFSIS